MEKLKINKILSFIAFIIIFLTINILICEKWFPKFIKSQEALIDINFNESGSIDFYTNNYNGSRSNDGIYIRNNTDYTSSAALVLESKKNEKPYIEWQIDKPFTYDHLAVESVAYHDNIKQNYSNFPGIWLYLADENKNIYWNLPHFVKVINYFSNQVKINYVFDIPDFTNKIYFSVINKSLSGDIIIDNLKLTPVKINSSFIVYRNIIYILLLIFISAFVIIFRKFLSKFKKHIIIVVLIVIGILGPKKYIYEFSEYINFDGVLLQKTGHFVLFMVLAFFIFLNKKYFYCNNKFLFNIYLFLLPVSFTVLTEMLQYFTIKRSMSFFDCIIDTAGIFIGILLSMAYIKIIKKHDVVTFF